MDLFISCDWGTSNFRLRIVDRDTSRILAGGSSDLGIATVFEQWRQTNKEEAARLPFFQTILLEQVQRLSPPSGFSPENLSLKGFSLEGLSLKGFSLKGLPLIISGMASSSLGMMELPYKELPVGISGQELHKVILPATDRFPHPMLIISGVRTADDVMRGEETQLIGCPAENGLYLFPGTHSKHIRVKEDKIVGFTTYMTGEFFHLLSQKSILTGAVTATDILQGPSGIPLKNDYQKSFEKGVEDSVEAGLLHSSFLVRTHHLFGRWSREENYNYLSGLLIGEELKDLVKVSGKGGSSAGERVFIVGSKQQRYYYQLACTLLNITVAGCLDADQALVRGHVKLYGLYQSEI
jgi:2-dehydro-3-deoxygalactonokinase